MKNYVCQYIDRNEKKTINKKQIFDNAKKGHINCWSVSVGILLDIN